MASKQKEARITQHGFLLRLNERNGYIRRFSVRFGGSKAQELERFIKFLFIGALGAMIDLGLTNLLMVFVFQVQDGDTLLVALAGSIGFSTAVCSNFFWNRYWTYPDSRSRRVRHQLVQFFVVSVVGLIIRAVVVMLLTNFFAGVVGELASHHLINLDLHSNVQFKIGANMAIMVALAIVAFWNFFVNRYWTYGDVDSTSPQNRPPQR